MEDNLQQGDPIVEKQVERSVPPDQFAPDGRLLGYDKDGELGPIGPVPVEPEVDPFISFIRDTYEAEGKTISNEDVANEYVANKDKKAQYVFDRYKKIKGKPIDINQFRKTADDLNFSQDDIDNIDGVVNDRNTFDQKMREGYSEYRKRNASFQKESTAEDFALNRIAEDAAEGAARDFAGPIASFGYDTAISVKKFAEGLFTDEEDDEDAIRLDSIRKDKTLSKKEKLDKLSSLYNENEEKNKEYRASLTKTPVPFIKTLDLIKRYSDEEDDLENVRDQVVSHEKQHVEYLNERAKGFAEKIENEDEQEIAKAILDGSFKGELPEQRSEDLNSFVDSVIALSRQQKEFANYDIAIGDTLGEDETFTQKLDRLTKKEQIKKDNTFSFGDIEIARKGGILDTKVFDAINTAEQAVKSGGWQIGSFFYDMAKAIGDPFVDTDEEEQFRKLKEGGFKDSTSVKRMYTELAKKETDAKIRALPITTKGSDATAPSLDKIVDIGGVRVRVDSNRQAIAIINDEGRIVSNPKGAQKEALDAYNSDPDKWFKQAENQFNYLPIVDATGESLVQMIPAIKGARLFSAVGARFLPAARMFQAGASANTVRTVQGLISSSGAGLVTGAMSFEDNYRSHLEKGNTREESLEFALGASATEGLITAFIGPGIEARFGASKANKIRKLVKDAGDNATEFVLKSAVSKADDILKTAAWQKSVSNYLNKNSKKYLGDNFSEVFEELLNEKAQALIQQDYGEGTGEVTAAQAVTVVGSTILSTSSMNSVLSTGNAANRDIDDALLFLANNNTTFLELNQGKDDDPDFIERAALVDRVREGMDINDQLVKDEKVTLTEDQNGVAEKIILDGAKKSESPESIKEKLQPLYEEAKVREAELKKEKELAEKLEAENDKASPDQTQEEQKELSREEKKKQFVEKKKGKSATGIATEQSVANNGAVGEPAPSSTANSENTEISDQEYNDFIDNNNVTPERISAIADKIVQVQELTPKEQEIRTARAQEVEALLGAKKKEDFDNRMKAAVDSPNVEITDDGKISYEGNAIDLDNIEVAEGDQGQVVTIPSTQEGVAPVVFEGDKAKEIIELSELNNIANGNFGEIFTEFANSDRGVEITNEDVSRRQEQDASGVSQGQAEQGASGDTGGSNTAESTGAAGADTDGTDASESGGKPGTKNRVASSGASTGAAQSGSDNGRQPSRASGKSAGQSFGKSKPYKSRSGRQYYFEGNQWKRIDTGESIGERELAELSNEFADRVLSDKNLLRQGKNIFGSKELVTNFLQASQDITLPFVEKAMKKKDPELYEQLLNVRKAIFEGDIQVVGYDDTAEFEAAVNGFVERFSTQVTTQDQNNSQVAPQENNDSSAAEIEVERQGESPILQTREGETRAKGKVKEEVFIGKKKTDKQGYSKQRVKMKETSDKLGVRERNGTLNFSLNDIKDSIKDTEFINDLNENNSISSINVFEIRTKPDGEVVIEANISTANGSVIRGISFIVKDLNFLDKLNQDNSEQTSSNSGSDQISTIKDREGNNISPESFTVNNDGKVSYAKLPLGAKFKGEKGFKGVKPSQSMVFNSGSGDAKTKTHVLASEGFVLAYRHGIAKPGKSKVNPAFAEAEAKSYGFETARELANYVKEVFEAEKLTDQDSVVDFRGSTVNKLNDFNDRVSTESKSQGSLFSKSPEFQTLEQQISQAEAELISARKALAKKKLELANARKNDQRDLFGQKRADLLKGPQASLFDTPDIDVSDSDVLAPFEARVNNAQQELNRLSGQDVDNTGTLFSKEQEGQLGLFGINNTQNEGKNKREITEEPTSGKGPVVTVYGKQNIPEYGDATADRFEGELGVHQKQGVSAITNAYRSGRQGFLLADGAGFGKTRQLIASAYNMVKDGLNPTIITENKQIIAGSFVKDSEAMGLYVSKNPDGSILIDGSIRVVTKTAYSSGKVDVDTSNSILVDESQNFSGLSSKMGEKLRSHEGFVVFSSATPFDTVDKTVYILPKLMGISQQEFLDRAGLALSERKRVAGGKSTVSVEAVHTDDGSKFIELLNSLHDLLISDGAMLHRRYEFYGDDKKVISIDPESDPLGQFDGVEDAENQIEEYYAERRKAVVLSEFETKKGVTLEEKQRQVSEQKVNELRRLHETFKATKSVVDNIKKKLSEGRQVVVYGVFTSGSITFNTPDGKKTRPAFIKQMEDLLNAEKIPYESITGANAKKGETVDRFQNGSTKVLLVNQTGTTGINLNDTVGNAPRTLYIAGTPPNAIQLDQLKGRVSRKNNKSEAEAILLHINTPGANDTIDSMNQKAAIMNSVLDGKKITVLDRVKRGVESKVDRGDVGLEVASTSGSESVDLSGNEIKISDLSVTLNDTGKSYTVKGNTFPLKDDIKSAVADNGRKLFWWNGKVKGWQFAASNKDQAVGVLNSITGNNNDSALLSKEPNLGFSGFFRGNVPQDILEKSRRGEVIPNKYLRLISDKVKRGFALDSTEAEIYRNNKDQVDAFGILPEGESMEATPSAVYKDGKIHINFSEYNLEDIQAAIIDAIVDKDGDKFLGALSSRLAGSNVFQDYFKNQKLDPIEVYQPEPDENSGSPSQEIIDKYQNAEKYYGLSREFTLEDGTIVRGKYVLTPWDSLSASHNPNNGFKKTPGFPVEKDGTTPNDRNYETDKNAQREVDKLAKSYDTRALTNPIFLTGHGVIIGGANRTLSAQLASEKGYDMSRYYKGIKQEADIFRVDYPRSIDFEGKKMALVVELDWDSPVYTKKEFKRFNKDAKKSKSPADKMREVIADLNPKVVNAITNSISEKSKSLTSYYNTPSRVRELRTLLLKEGIITSNLLPDYFEGEDDSLSLTDNGKTLIRAISLSNIIDNRLLELSVDEKMKPFFKRMDDMGVFLLRNGGLENDFNLKREINEAVELAFKISSSGKKIPEYIGNVDLFSDSEFTTASVVLTYLIGNSAEGSTALRKDFAKKYQEAENSFNPGGIFQTATDNKYKLIEDVANAIIGQKDEVVKLRIASGFKPNEDVKLADAQADRDMLRIIGSNGYGPDVFYNKKPEGLLSKDVGSIFSQIMADVVSSGDNKLYDSLTRSVNKAMSTIASDPSKFLKDSGINEIAFLRAVLGEPYQRMEPHKKTLNKLKQLKSDNAINVSADDIYEAHATSFKSRGISRDDLKNAIGEVEVVRAQDLSDVTEDVLEAQNNPDTSNEAEKYYKGQGLAEKASKFFAQIHDLMPQKIKALDSALLIGKEIMTSGFGGGLKSIKSYPFTTAEITKISEDYSFDPKFFKTKVVQAFIQHSGGKRSDGFAGIEDFLGSVYEVAREQGLLRNGLHESIANSLGIQEDIKPGTTFVDTDNKFYEIVSKSNNNGENIYSLKSLETGDQILLSENSPVFQSMNEVLPQGNDQLKERLSNVLRVLSPIIPDLQLELMTPAQMKSRFGQATRGAYVHSEKTIYLNESAAEGTIIHEGAHAVIVNAFLNNPDAIHIIHNAVVNALENGNTKEQEIARRVADHVSMYNESDANDQFSFEQVKSHEYLAELVKILTEEDIQIEKPSWTKIIDKIKEAVNTFLPEGYEFDIVDADDAIDFINGLAKAFNNGSLDNNSRLKITENEVLGKGSLMSKEKEGVFTLGDNVTIYELSENGIKPWIENGNINFLYSFPDGRNVVEINGEYFDTKEFSFDRDGNIIVSNAQAAIRPSVEVSDSQQDIIDDIVPEAISEGLYDTAEELWADFGDDTFAPNGISLGTIKKEFDKLKPQQEAPVNDAIKPLLSDNRVNDTIKRLVSITPETAQQIAIERGVELKNEAESQEWIIDEVKMAVAPLIGDADAIWNYYKELEKREPSISSQSSLGLSSPGDGKVDARVYIPAIVQLAYHYSTLVGDTDGVMADRLMEMKGKVNALSTNAAWGLRVFRKEFTGLPLRSTVAFLFDSENYAVAKNLRGRQLGGVATTVGEFVDQLRDDNAFTAQERATILSEIAKSDKISDILGETNVIDEVFLNILLEEFDRIRDNDNGTDAFLSKDIDNNDLIKLINKAFRGIDPSSTDKDLFGNPNDLKQFMNTLGRFIELKTGKKADEFYKSNPDIVGALERNYKKAFGDNISKKVNKKSKRTTGLSAAKKALEGVDGRVKKNIISAYNSLPKSYKKNSKDKIKELSELFEDRYNARIAINSAIQKLGHSLKYTPDPKKNAEIAKAIQDLKRLSENLVDADNNFVNFNESKLFSAINYGISNLSQQDLSDIGVDVSADVDPKRYASVVLSSIINKSMKQGDVSVKTLAQKIVSGMNLSPKDAVAIAEVINKAYKSKVAAAKVKKMEQALSGVSKKKILGGARRKTVVDTMKRYIEDGVLTNDALLEGFYKKFDIQSLDSDTKKRIGELMEQMESSDPGLVQAAEKEFALVVQGMSSGGFASARRVLMNMRMVNLLSGYSTALVSLVGAVTATQWRRVKAQYSFGRQGSLLAWRNFRKEHPELAGLTLGQYTQAILNGSFDPSVLTSASTQLAINAFKDGSIVLTMEDNPSGAISSVELYTNKVLARVARKLPWTKLRKRAEDRLVRLGVETGDRSGWSKAKDAILLPTVVMPIMMVRSLQAMDAYLNNKSVEREAFLEAWDLTAKQFPGKPLSQKNEAFFKALKDNMGVGLVLDKNGQRVTYEQKLEDTVKAIQNERGRTLSAGEIAVLSKQIVLDARKNVYIDPIPKDATKGVKDLLEGNRRTLASLTSDRSMDVSLLNHEVRGFATGLVAGFLSMPKQLVFQAEQDRVAGRSFAYGTKMMLAGASALFFPIVKVVANNIYKSYRHSIPSAVVKLGAMGLTKFAGYPGVNEVRFDTRKPMTRAVLINGIPAEELNTLDGGRVRSLSSKLTDGTSEVAKALNAIPETKVASEDYWAGMISSGIIAPLAYVWWAFDWDEEEQGFVKNKEAWDIVDITGKGWGDYWTNQKKFGRGRKDNNFSIMGVHTRLTEFPAASLFAAMGQSGDEVEMHGSVSLGRMMYNNLWGGLQNMAVDGYAIGTNNIGELLALGKKARTYNTAKPDETEGQKAARLNNLAKARNKIGKRLGSMVSSQFLPNFYKKIENAEEGLRGKPKNDVDSGPIGKQGLSKYLVSDRSYVAGFLNTMLNNTPWMNDYFFDHKHDILGNPIATDHDVLLIPDDFEQRVSDYVMNSDKDDLTRFMTREADYDSGQIYNIRSKAHASNKNKGFYYHGKDRDELNLIWSQEFRKIMEKPTSDGPFWRKLQKMTPEEQSRAIAQIAKQVKKMSRIYIQEREKRKVKVK